MEPCVGNCSVCTNECFDRINPPHWPMETTVVVEEEGLVGERTIKNIKHGKFLVDQVFGFRVNDAKDREDSITIHRCIIPAGTAVEEGYTAVRAFVKHIVDGDPIQVLRDIGFLDVIGEVVDE